eukprot:gene1824-33243_t
MAAPVLAIEPSELVFKDVHFGQTYEQTVELYNTLKGTAEADIKASCLDRYTVSPSSIRLKAGESALIRVRLKVIKFGNKQKAVAAGQRDAFHIKSKRIGTMLETHKMADARPPAERFCAQNPTPPAHRFPKSIFQAPCQPVALMLEKLVKVPADAKALIALICQDPSLLDKLQPTGRECMDKLIGRRWVRWLH